MQENEHELPEQPVEQPEEQPIEQPEEQPIEQPEEQPEEQSVEPAESVELAEPIAPVEALENEPVELYEDDIEPGDLIAPEVEEILPPAKPERKNWQRVYALIVTALLALSVGIMIGTLIHVVGGDKSTISAKTLQHVRNYTVVITAKSDTGVSTGTGIILTEDGYIATNYHVIEGATTIKVNTWGGLSAIAQVVGFSEIDDIAVIKIEAEGLHVATFERSAYVKDAQNVYAVGTPAGEEYAWSVTKGVVSFAQREVKIYDDEGILQKKMKLIQTDTPVNPGNSGGPLVTSDGHVIGIITMKLSGQYENMGFAIPIDGAMVLIDNIIKTGEPGESPITTKRPLIGIVGVGVQADCYYIDLGEKIQQVDQAYAAEHPTEVFYAAYTGVWVQQTTPGMDAANKLQAGDIIVLADGHELDDIYDLMNVINEHNGGETVELTFYRNGVANIVEVELGYAD